MKNIFITLMSAVTLVLSGCKSLPSVETMETTATSIGKAAGYVANQTSIDNKSREVVIEIMTRASTVVPGQDESFVSAWTPIANEVLDKMIEDGKIDENQASLISGAFTVACKGLDYIVSVRFPKAKQYENLVSAAVKGFTLGFLEVFKPANGVLAVPLTNYDKEAYDFLVSGESVK